ncbi:MAG: hypothetical protein JRE23_16780 [Deltaproteobacteria bacterium]|nr:hypothetical protein [Deltaproteobacteria bacterium]
MRSQGRKTRVDKLVLHWDHKAPSSVDIEKMTDTKRHGQRSLQEYFDLLAETKPSRSELTDVKIFETIFTLP